MNSSIDKYIETLNFSGDETSWFDLYHIHLNQRVNKAAVNNRERSLLELIRIYETLEEKLKSYPKDYQLWIEIYDNDPDDDAVYIHSQNPNSNNFPLKIQIEYPPELEDSELKGLLLKQGLSVAGQRLSEGNVYFLFKNNVGVSLL